MASLLDTHLGLLHRYACSMIVRECNSYSSGVMCCLFCLVRGNSSCAQCCCFLVAMFAHVPSLKALTSLCCRYFLPVQSDLRPLERDVNVSVQGRGLGILAGELATRFSDDQMFLQLTLWNALCSKNALLMRTNTLYWPDLLCVCCSVLHF